MSNETSDIFSYEFRHDAVIDFIRKLMEGTIKFKEPTEDSKEIRARVINDISDLVSKYCSGQNREQLGELEQKIFYNIAQLRGFNLIQETKVNMPEIERRIGQLETSIASTNRLLLQVLDVLNQIVRRLPP